MYKEDHDRLVKIRAEIIDLVEEARGLVRMEGKTSEYNRADAYWLGYMSNALDDANSPLLPCTMEDTINALDPGEDDESEDESDEDEEEVSDKEKISDLAEEYGSLRRNYSGRGMFGKTCYGIDTSRSDELIKAASRIGLTKASVDNMGLDYIVYWEAVSDD